MFRLSDLYTTILKKGIPTQCGITCEVVEPYIPKLNHLLTETLVGAILLCTLANLPGSFRHKLTLTAETAGVYVYYCLALTART
ncbi:MAG: hypothetical protein HDR88_10865 [Bacteroides sp.]|nr:hypothetical protein [Bacteroides sp.]